MTDVRVKMIEDIFVLPSIFWGTIVRQSLLLYSSFAGYNLILPSQSAWCVKVVKCSSSSVFFCFVFFIAIGLIVDKQFPHLWLNVQLARLKDFSQCPFPWRHESLRVSPSCWKTGDFIKSPSLKWLSAETIKCSVYYYSTYR